MKNPILNLCLAFALLLGSGTSVFGDLIAHYTFEQGDELTDLTGNWPDLVLEGNAAVADGQLDVNGGGTTATGWAHTGAGDYTGPAGLNNKTLVGWVSLQADSPTARAGSVITIDTKAGDVFDGIIWAEQAANRWMNGSNGFVRTMDFGATADEPGPFDGTNEVQIAISYEDLGGGSVQITGYRNGLQIGQYTDDQAGQYSNWTASNTELILGKRHGNPVSGVPGALDALIQEVQIYNEVLDAAAIAALTPIGSEDTDDDGLPDSWEQEVIDLDPNDAIDSLDDINPGDDLDGDTLTNAQEFASPRTNPLDPDTDGDTLSDLVETNTGVFVSYTPGANPPLTATGDTGTNPNDPDTDGDTIRDDHETGTMVFNSPTDTGTDPNKKDTDGDGLSDDFEIGAPFSDPNDPADPPAPPLDAFLVGQWTFEEGVEAVDLTGNWPDLVLEGDAAIADGQLDVNGAGAGPATGWAHTDPAGDYTGPAITNKTLVSWLSLQSDSLTTRAGSALTIDTKAGDIFDGIIFAEQAENRWMNGSNGFVRTMDFGAGADEPGPFDGTNEVMIAITYEVTGGNVEITGYRNGVLMGQYTDDQAGQYSNWTATNTEVIMGKRHGNPLSGGPGALDALIQESRIYAINATGGQILNLFNAGPGGTGGTGGAKLPLAVNKVGPDLVFTWPSKDGKLYNLRSVTDPGAPIPPATEPPSPLEWPIFGTNEDIAATAPENTLVIPLPADAGRYFVVEEFIAPPVSVFAENFDGAAAIPAGWTTGANPPDDTGTTVWEFGTPANVGPPAALSAPNCAATNLTAAYEDDADISLRTPPIDLTAAGGATLNFAHFFDIETQFDSGTVLILDANDGDSVIAELATGIEGVSLDWEQFSEALPASVLGNVIKVEWRFRADNFNSAPQAGWHLDDVVVTVP